jgi:hypothetical protein
VSSTIATVGFAPAGDAGPGALTFGFAYSNDVYESPWPNGKSGSMPCVSNQCFTKAATFCDCIPRIQGTTICDAGKGSSLKYSKFPPPSGVRWMLTAGPSMMCLPRATASSPIVCP